MNTTILNVSGDSADDVKIEAAGNLLKEGKLVAFPTETVYGLGANALDEEAAARIYSAKGRPSDNPLIVHIADWDALGLIVKEIPPEAKLLADKFWPGPLTMIFKKSDRVPYGTTGGLETVAVRMPSHPVAMKLIRAGGGYIAAPSANTSGRPSPTRAEHVKEDLDGRIDMILDGGEVNIGLESTIVDLSEGVPTILRPGYITKEMLEEVLGKVEVDQAIIRDDSNIVPKAPGMNTAIMRPRPIWWWWRASRPWSLHGSMSWYRKNRSTACGWASSAPRRRKICTMRTRSVPQAAGRMKNPSPAICLRCCGNLMSWTWTAFTRNPLRGRDWDRPS